MYSQSLRNWIKNLGQQLLTSGSRHPSRPSAAATKRKDGRSIRPMFDVLEDRIVPNGTWTELSAPATGTMLLQPNGTVMVNQSNGAAWYQLTPDSTGSYVTGSWSYQSSMSTARLYYGSVILPNDNVMVYGGEYTGGSSETDVNSGEIYNPSTNTWTVLPSVPASLDPTNAFGDGTLQVLPNGTVFAAYLNGPQTFIYNPTSNSWSAGPTKLNGDRSDEEGFVKLPGTGGNMVDYEIWQSLASSPPGYAEYLNTATNSWVQTGGVPVPLTESNEDELGPGILLPNGEVFQIGANGNWPVTSSNTALYDPVANTWTAGPVIPDDYIADDAPAAILPDGNVIFVADTSETSNPTYQYTGPSAIFEYSYVSNTITQLTGLPTALNNDLTSSANNYSSSACYNMRMLVLPTGQVLFSDGTNVWTYSESTAANPAWAPTIANVANNGSGHFTVTGTQLNGIDEGAAYGDDAQMATNFPIVQITDSNGNVFYAQTSNWSLPGTVATGSTTESTQFTLPAGVAPGNISVVVIANGIPSASFAASTFKDWIVTNPNGNAGSGSLNDVTLPYAVANAQNGDSITFSSCLNGSTITLNSTLTLAHNVTITGLGAANVAVSGGGSVQDFFVDSGVSIVMSGMTIENGTESGLGGGGGMLNAGSVFMYDCILSGNNGASGGTYNPYGSGGGILNTGSLTLVYTTLENNTASYGGGLENYGGSATTFIEDCTITGNTAGSAAGVNDYAGGSLTLSDSTVAYNNGYGVYVTSMDNCIVADNTLGAIWNGTTGSYTLTSVTGLAASLVYNNGAATPTLALSPGSSAIGTGDPGESGTTAQNGEVRTSGNVDVGACEGGYDWVVTDPNGDTGSGGPGDITLPYAVTHVDSGDQITFSPLLNGDTIPLNGTLTLAQNVTILGPGAANLAVSGGGAVQDFFVNSAVSASISGLTIDNGTESGLGGGGGILNTGNLTVSDCIIANNNGASGGTYDIFGSGGGILNTGSLTLSDSTVDNNTANYGGGLENYGPNAYTSINDCTFTGNTASYGSAGGVNNYDGGYLGLTNSTVAFNNGYGVYATAMDNCIVVGNTSGAIWEGTSGTYTLTGGVALSPTLAYNGGSTPTLALLPGSSAIGAGDPNDAGTVAQNGAVRIAGRVDVGATEGGFDWVVTDPNGHAGSGSYGDITLPFAVANAQDGDEITFSSCVNGDVITLNSTLTISRGVTITGPGARNLAVSGGGTVQDFFVNSGFCATISGLTIENGTETGLGGGGGILNTGMLTLSNCVISGNNGDSGGTYDIFGSGGGILNTGLLTLSNSTVENNVAIYGGGLENYNQGSATINDCTFTGNTGYSGAGINNYDGGPLTLTNSTVAYNNGYGVDVTAMDNCIVAGNTSGAIFPGGATGTFTLTSVTGLATTLAYNGGTTPTLALSPGSSALGGAGDPAQAGTTAENGVTRAAGNVAVGAFQGADWVVTDPNGNAGSGSPGDITLPYAVANAQNGDSITFASTLSGQTIVLNATLTIGHSYTITGLGSANLAVSGGNSVQDFIVSAGVTTTISGLTIENGSFAAFSSSSDGAGIDNNGALTLTNDAISNNGTIGNGVTYLGAGVYNGGSLNVADCTFTGNVSYYNGGALYNAGTATVSNSTIYGNAAYTFGGGIDNAGLMTLSDDTVTANFGWDNVPNFPEYGGGIYNGGTLQMDNTIVAGNASAATSGPDIYGTIASANYCLIGTSSGNTVSSGAHNLTGSAGLTNSLAYNNGAPTQTLALVPGSQVIGAGDPSQAGTNAQNGILRAAGAVDIGACQGGVTWVVTDPNGNAGSGSLLDITLPYAVAHAQDGDVITFAGGLSGDTVLLNSPLVIGHSYTISGLGSANLAVSGGSSVQDFVVNSGVCATILGLTIENGLAADGAGIENSGMLSLIDDAVSNNATLSIGGNDGGGIYNSGSLSVYDSTVNGNSAYTDGGGLYNTGTATLSNSTVFGNAGWTDGGGIFNSGSLTLTNDTIAGNTGYGGFSDLPIFGGGIYNSGTLQMDNTIVAGNGVASTIGPDVYGTIAACNYCLIGNPSGATYSGVGNLTGSAGLAAALAYNGGPTKTLALLSGSQAIGAGDPGQAGTYSQNGVLRPTPPDIGAYQLPAPVITNVVIDQNISALYNAAGQPAPGTQRSMVDDVVYTFSEAVNIVSSGVDPSVFTIAVAAGWTGTVPTLSWAPVSGSGDTQWAVTFSGASVTGGSIANGAYTITVNHPAEITAMSDSQQLTLAGSGIGGATQSFYRLFGDINGDEVVNAADNLKFKQALTTYNAAFDYNDDGTVNAADNLKFKNDLTVNFSGFTPTI